MCYFLYKRSCKKSTNKLHSPIYFHNFNELFSSFYNIFILTRNSFSSCYYLSGYYCCYNNLFSYHKFWLYILWSNSRYFISIGTHLWFTRMVDQLGNSPYIFWSLNRCSLWILPIFWHLTYSRRKKIWAISWWLYYCSCYNLCRYYLLIFKNSRSTWKN